MSKPDPSIFLTCTKCKEKLMMEDYSIDTQTCYNKHVFFFRCAKCNGFSATAMANLDQSIWPRFIEEERLDEVVEAYTRALK